MRKLVRILRVMNGQPAGSEMTVSNAEFKMLEKRGLVELVGDAPAEDEADQASAGDVGAEGAENDQLPKVSSTMTKAELVAIAENEGVAYEGDDNKSSLIAKIEAARA